MYDPLIDPGPGQGMAYPSSYWLETLTSPPTLPAPLDKDIEVDVAIIGGGYTGMATSLFLAREHGIKAVILEANKVAFGASGRNAGFALPSTGRLGISAIAQRWGNDVAKLVLAEYRGSVELVKQLIDDYGIACQPQTDGYLKVAHNHYQYVAQQKIANTLQEQFDYPVELLDQHQLGQYFNSPLAKGAIRFPDGFGLNPLQLAMGYRDALQQHDQAVYEHTPVTDWRQHQDRHQLITPMGVVTAHQVICAGNAYTPKQFHPLLDQRSLPVQSSIIVTQAFSDAELTAAGLHSHQVIMDTRALKYYFRRLPDNRILFGGRGAINGHNSDAPVFQQRLLKALMKNLPGLAAPRIEFAWSGWINVSLDDIPHIYGEQGVYYSTGYCGSGVAYSAQAGRRLASLVAGQPIPGNIPHYQQPLPKFPLPAFRRIGQWGYYQYGRLKDQFF